MLKDIILTTLLLLGKENELVEVETKEESEYSPATKSLISQLIKIVNLVASDITRDAVRLTFCETLTSDENCEIKYSSLSKKVIGVKSVTEGNKDATFNLYPEYIKVGKPNTKYKITYNYENQKCKSIDDDIVFPVCVTCGIVAYGVASEYCSMNLLYDECTMWEQKYVRALENIMPKTGERKMARWWNL